MKDVKVKIFKFRAKTSIKEESNMEKALNSFLEDKELIELKVNPTEVNVHRNLGYSPLSFLVYTIIYREI